MGDVQRAISTELALFFEEENPHIAAAVLSRPAKRGRQLAKAIAMMLEPIEGGTKLSPKDHSIATTEFIRRLPRVDRLYVESLVMRLHKRLFDAVVTSLPPELAELMEEVRIR